MITGVQYSIQQLSPVVLLDSIYQGFHMTPRENSSEAKDLVITNAVECSFSLFSQTIADQTRVD
jgi:hypothetical protein